MIDSTAVLWPILALIAICFVCSAVISALRHDELRSLLETIYWELHRSDALGNITDDGPGEGLGGE